MSEKKDLFTPIGPHKGGLLGVLHSEEGCSMGLLRPTRHGQPIHGRAVHLRPREDGHFDCETIYQGPATSTSTGPAKVTSNAYRDDWDAIFGGDSSSARVLN